MRSHPKGFTTIGLAIVVLFSLPFVANFIINQQAKNEIYKSTQEIPPMEAALILGAAAWGPELSAALSDRVDVGIELYKNEKVNQLIMSGAPNETEVMRNYAIERGVNDQDIVEDSNGENTLASIQNLNPETSVIIVTQDYHLPRALFMARQYKVEAVGISASLQEYEKIDQFKQREFFAIVWTALNFWVLRN